MAVKGLTVTQKTSLGTDVKNGVPFKRFSSEFQFDGGPVAGVDNTIGETWTYDGTGKASKDDWKKLLTGHGIERDGNSNILRIPAIVLGDEVQKYAVNGMIPCVVAPDEIQDEKGKLHIICGERDAMLAAADRLAHPTMDSLLAALFGPGGSL